MVLELRGVSKRYLARAPLIVDNVDLAVRPGTLVAIHGTNGSGKSTLLRMAAGFVRPTHGEVIRSCARFGYVPDRALPTPRMTGRDYLRHLAHLAGNRSLSKAGETLATRFDLQPGLDVPIANLSRGNLQKLILVQALMRPTQLVVMDEPLTALDVPSTAVLYDVVRERLQEGCAVLLATHDAAFNDLGEAFTFVDGRLTPGAEPTLGTRYVIELDDPADHNWRQTHTVTQSQVAGVLHAALAANRRVRSLNPIEPNPRGQR